MIKAAGGGGGKGMEIVEKETDLESLFLLAKKVKQKNFLIMMNYISRNILKNPRHIEVQIMSGSNG